MFQEYHALPVQASIMLDKFPDTGTNDGHVLVVPRAIYTTNFMKLQQDSYKRFSENKYLHAW